MRALVAVLAISAFALTACGSEVGRVRFSSDGSGEGSATLKAGDVAFWTDIDLAYKGDAALVYRIELVQGGTPVATAVCNPLGRIAVKTRWTETNLGGSHTRHGLGKMDCSAVVPKDGATTVKAALVFERKPQDITLKKADLVLKQ